LFSSFLSKRHINRLGKGSGIHFMLFPPFIKMRIEISVAVLVAEFSSTATAQKQVIPMLSGFLVAEVAVRAS